MQQNKQNTACRSTLTEIITAFFDTLRLLCNAYLKMKHVTEVHAARRMGHLEI